MHSTVVEHRLGVTLHQRLLPTLVAQASTMRTPILGIVLMMRLPLVLRPPQLQQTHTRHLHRQLQLQHQVLLDTIWTRLPLRLVHRLHTVVMLKHLAGEEKTMDHITNLINGALG